MIILIFTAIIWSVQIVLQAMASLILTVIVCMVKITLQATMILLLLAASWRALFFISPSCKSPFSSFPVIFMVYFVVFSDLTKKWNQARLNTSFPIKNQCTLEEELQNLQSAEKVLWLKIKSKTLKGFSIIPCLNYLGILPAGLSWH